MDTEHIALGGHGFDGAGGDPDDRLRARLIDEIECGLIVCDGAGTVRFANRSAQQELASQTLLRRVGQTLQCGAASNPSLDAALRLAQVKGRRQLVELSRADDRLLVSVVPLHLHAPDETLVMVMLGRRGLCSTLGLEMLSSVHGLTLAERRVLAALLNEVTPREIARAHGVALSTVRTQISSIRGKLGVRSVEALLIRLAEVPPVPGVLRCALDSLRSRPASVPAGTRLN